MSEQRDYERERQVLDWNRMKQIAHARTLWSGDALVQAETEIDDSYNMEFAKLRHDALVEALVRIGEKR